jgi:hypothetical protein
MALTPVQIIRVITQDNGNLPFLGEGEYILSDEELEMYLELTGDNVLKASRMAAYAISLWVSGVNTKEVTGEIEVWNDVSKNYLKAITGFLGDASLMSVLPRGLMPYAAGVSVADLAESILDSDNPNICNWLYRKPKVDCCVSSVECLDDINTLNI